MPITNAVATLSAKSSQCDSLIANAHRLDPGGQYLFPLIDRQQITIAAFLNLFVAWEEFIESVLCNFMAGAATLSGVFPVKYVSPPTIDFSKKILIGAQRYFDYANHENLRKIAGIYFEAGYPFETPLSSVLVDLGDLRTMRNSSAHISSSTQRALESLAQRIFGAPRPVISLYDMLTAVDPRSSTGNTVFGEARDKLLITAQLIAQG